MPRISNPKNIRGIMNSTAADIFFALASRHSRLYEACCNLIPRITRLNTHTPLKNIVISSEKGLFILNDNIATRLLLGYTFGFSYSSATQLYYSSISSKDRSSVLQFSLNSKYKINKTKVIFSQWTRYHNEKIHQLTTSNGLLFIANTANNCITIISEKDAQEGVERRINIYPFSDNAGYPIHKDHNHINSVAMILGKLCFVCHNGGTSGSLICYLDGQIVNYIKYPNRGCHDIFNHEGRIAFTDSFGQFNSGTKSFVQRPAFINGNSRFPIEKAKFLRGIYYGLDSIFIGESFHAHRDLRSTGNAAIHQVDASSKRQIGKYRIKFCSQIHDLISLEGKHTIAEETHSDFLPEYVFGVTQESFLQSKIKCSLEAGSYKREAGSYKSEYLDILPPSNLKEFEEVFENFSKRSAAT